MASGSLYLVPTPLGNLEDVTVRALRILQEVDWIAAEDTRRARILFQTYNITRRPRAHHAHNEHREVPRLLERLRRGESGALVTDAGMPGISDPGFLLAREARRAGIPVVVLPGPSAVLTALLASGFPPEPFLFLGYAPKTAGRRASFLEGVACEPRTVVFFEVPHRLRALLEAAIPVLETRTLAVARELTKLHEEVLRGSAAQLLEEVSDPVRGEIVVVVSPLARRDRVRVKRSAESEDRESDSRTDSEEESARS